MAHSSLMSNSGHARVLSLFFATGGSPSRPCFPCQAHRQERWSVLWEPLDSVACKMPNCGTEEMVVGQLTGQATFKVELTSGLDERWSHRGYYRGYYRGCTTNQGLLFSIWANQNVRLPRGATVAKQVDRPTAHQAAPASLKHTLRRQRC